MMQTATAYCGVPRPPASPRHDAFPALPFPPPKSVFSLLQPHRHATATVSQSSSSSSSLAFPPLSHGVAPTVHPGREAPDCVFPLWQHSSSALVLSTADGAFPLTATLSLSAFRAPPSGLLHAAVEGEAGRAQVEEVSSEDEAATYGRESLCRAREDAADGGGHPDGAEGERVALEPTRRPRPGFPGGERRGEGGAGGQRGAEAGGAATAEGEAGGRRQSGASPRLSGSPTPGSTRQSSRLLSPAEVSRLLLQQYPPPPSRPHPSAPESRETDEEEPEKATKRRGAPEGELRHAEKGRLPLPADEDAEEGNKSPQRQKSLSVASTRATALSWSAPHSRQLSRATSSSIPYGGQEEEERGSERRLSRVPGPAASMASPLRPLPARQPAYPHSPAFTRLLARAPSMNRLSGSPDHAAVSPEPTQESGGRFFAADRERKTLRALSRTDLAPPALPAPRLGLEARAPESDSRRAQRRAGGREALQEAREEKDANDPFAGLWSFFSFAGSTRSQAAPDSCGKARARKRRSGEKEVDAWGVELECIEEESPSREPAHSPHTLARRRRSSMSTSAPPSSAEPSSLASLGPPSRTASREAGASAQRSRLGGAASRGQSAPPLGAVAEEPAGAEPRPSSRLGDLGVTRRTARRVVPSPTESRSLRGFADQVASLHSLAQSEEEAARRLQDALASSSPAADGSLSPSSSAAPLQRAAIVLGLEAGVDGDEDAVFHSTKRGSAPASLAHPLSPRSRGAVTEGARGDSGVSSSTRASSGGLSRAQEARGETEELKRQNSHKAFFSTDAERGGRQASALCAFSDADAKSRKSASPVGRGGSVCSAIPVGALEGRRRRRRLASPRDFPPPTFERILFGLPSEGEQEEEAGGGRRGGGQTEGEEAPRTRAARRRRPKASAPVFGEDAAGTPRMRCKTTEKPAAAAASTTPAPLSGFSLLPSFLSNLLASSAGEEPGTTGGGGVGARAKGRGRQTEGDGARGTTSTHESAEYVDLSHANISYFLSLRDETSEATSSSSRESSPAPVMTRLWMRSSRPSPGATRSKSLRAFLEASHVERPPQALAAESPARPGEPSLRAGASRPLEGHQRLDELPHARSSAGAATAPRRASPDLETQGGFRSPHAAGYGYEGEGVGGGLSLSSHAAARDRDRHGATDTCQRRFDKPGEQRSPLLSRSFQGACEKEDAVSTRSDERRASSAPSPVSSTSGSLILDTDPESRPHRSHERFRISPPEQKSLRCVSATRARSPRQRDDAEPQSRHLAYASLLEELRRRKQRATGPARSRRRESAASFDEGAQEVEAARVAQRRRERQRRGADTGSTPRDFLLSVTRRLPSPVRPLSPTRGLGERAATQEEHEEEGLLFARQSTSSDAALSPSSLGAAERAAGVRRDAGLQVAPSRRRLPRKERRGNASSCDYVPPHSLFIPPLRTSVLEAKRSFREKIRRSARGEPLNASLSSGLGNYADFDDEEDGSQSVRKDRDHLDSLFDLPFASSPTRQRLQDTVNRYALFKLFDDEALSFSRVSDLDSRYEAGAASSALSRDVDCAESETRSLGTPPPGKFKRREVSRALLEQLGAATPAAVLDSACERTGAQGPFACAPAALWDPAAGRGELRAEENAEAPERESRAEEEGNATARRQALFSPGSASRASSGASSRRSSVVASVRRSPRMREETRDGRSEKERTRGEWTKPEGVPHLPLDALPVQLGERRGRARDDRKASRDPRRKEGRKLRDRYRGARKTPEEKEARGKRQERSREKSKRKKEPRKRSDEAESAAACSWRERKNADNLRASRRAAWSPDSASSASLSTASSQLSSFCSSSPSPVLSSSASSLVSSPSSSSAPTSRETGRRRSPPREKRRASPQARSSSARLSSFSSRSCSPLSPNPQRTSGYRSQKRGATRSRRLRHAAKKEACEAVKLAEEKRCDMSRGSHSAARRKARRWREEEDNLSFAVRRLLAQVGREKAKDPRAANAAGERPQAYLQAARQALLRHQRDIETQREEVRFLTERRRPRAGRMSDGEDSAADARPPCLPAEARTRWTRPQSVQSEAKEEPEETESLADLGEAIRFLTGQARMREGREGGTDSDDGEADRDLNRSGGEAPRAGRPEAAREARRRGDLVRYAHERGFAAAHAQREKKRASHATLTVGARASHSSTAARDAKDLVDTARTFDGERHFAGSLIAERRRTSSRLAFGDEDTSSEEGARERRRREPQRPARDALVSTEPFAPASSSSEGEEDIPSAFNVLWRDGRHSGRSSCRDTKISGSQMRYKLRMPA
ncbi:hypothetical protein BESB_062420 [Besnoitia besnoiti]|uniref:Uncharacterized protein n=1 Tax=Besnoitia besnoiti TaxID=94643 RepID=A0A2A9MBL4_BESBE|nr:hypothetical protein BESB_062420 [Besnoitia besnoiti]PFH35355.1 hypothetical protein BESB_062420 [Besnoitia besnoiti]